MNYLEYIKFRKNYFFDLYQKELDINQKYKYMHFYEAYYILLNELKELENK
jgi:hypothetical protein